MKGSEGAEDEGERRSGERRAKVPVGGVHGWAILSWRGGAALPSGLAVPLALLGAHVSSLVCLPKWPACPGCCLDSDLARGKGPGLLSPAPGGVGEGIRHPE